MWGLFGYGLVGHVTLDDAAADAIETGTGLLLGAFGVDGLLLAAARADGLLLRMTSEAATGLAASEADLSRWRLLLEASYAGLPLLGGELRPALAVGGRYDAGEAETGSGLVLSGSTSAAGSRSPPRGAASRRSCAGAGSSATSRRASASAASRAR